MADNLVATKPQIREVQWISTLMNKRNSYTDTSNVVERQRQREDVKSTREEKMISKGSIDLLLTSHYHQRKLQNCGVTASMCREKNKTANLELDTTLQEWEWNKDICRQVKTGIFYHQKILTNENSKCNILQAELKLFQRKGQTHKKKIGQDTGKHLEGNYKNLDCRTPQ